MAATKALFLLGLIALFAVATARSDSDNVADAVGGVVPAGSRALLSGKLFPLKFNFDFHSYGHEKYILHKKFYGDDYEKDVEEDEEKDEEYDDCDEEDNDDCKEKVFYRICYLKKNHKRCDCKKEHKSVYYVVKYRKSKCH